MTKQISSTYNYIKLSRSHSLSLWRDDERHTKDEKTLGFAKSGPVSEREISY